MRLVLTIDELRNFKLLVKNKATKSVSCGVLCAFLQLRLFCVYVIVLSVYIVTSAWGFRRCSFRQEGQCEGLSIVERVTDWLHVFLYVFINFELAREPVNKIC